MNKLGQIDYEYSWVYKEVQYLNEQRIQAVSSYNAWFDYEEWDEDEDEEWNNLIRSRMLMQYLGEVLAIDAEYEELRKEIDASKEE